MANSGIYETDYLSDDDHNSLFDNSSLYSDADVRAGAEADADAESPADGYFTQRPFPESQFVENSSIAAEAETKAREAAENRATSSQAQPSSQTISPTSATRSSVWENANEHTPLLDAGPAPPDYAAATAHRRAESSQSEHATLPPTSPTRSYGSMASPANGDAAPQQHDDERQWPFGSRGNPFQSPNFPFGPGGNPVNQPGFPFAQTNAFFAQHYGSAGNAGAPLWRPQPAQSMTDRPPQYGQGDEQGEEDGLWRQYRNRRDRRSWRSWGGRFTPKSVLSWFGVLCIVGLLIFASQATLKPHSDTDMPSEGDHGTLPVAPSIPDNEHETPPEDTFPIPRDLSHCRFTRFSKAYEFKFSEMGNFTFMELLEAHSNLRLDLSGTIYMMSAPKEQDTDILITVSYATTSMWRVTSPHFIMEQTGINLQFPNIEKEEPMDSSEPSCMDVGVAISIKPGVHFDDWFIGTANLNVQTTRLESDDTTESLVQPMIIANTSSINTMLGNVDLSYWNSRHTVVETISGSIRGRFALRDLLSVKSQSGSIGILVDPKEEEAGRPAPAEFSARSTSGSVTVDYPVGGKIPDREYRTRVATQSSSIKGSYILGLLTSFTTVSGSITTSLLPYDSTAPLTSLRTESRSGSTNLKVLEPYRNASKPMSNLHSYHRTSAGSGSIRVEYPEQWTGTIDAETLTGGIKLMGKGVEVDVDGRYSPMVRHVLAHKGDGDSRLDLRSSSGSMYVRVGDE